MRIAALTPYYPPGRNAGSEVMLRWMMDSLVRAGHEVVVLATDAEEIRGQVIQQDGAEVHFTDPKSAEKYLIGYRPDVIVSQQTRIPDAAKVRKATGAKVAAVIHSEWLYTEHWLRTNPDLLVFNTHYIHELYGKGKPNEIVIHPPVWAREHRTTPGDCITLVNMIEAKGAYTFYELTNDFPDKKFLGVIGGYGPQIVPSELPSNVEIVPNTSDMRGDVWSRTRILLMPSSTESYGMAAVEALQSGIPVIASPTEGLGESLSYSGIFVPRNDIDGWVRAIQYVEENYEQRSALAWERAQELDPTYELSQWVSAIETLIRR